MSSTVTIERGGEPKTAQAAGSVLLVLGAVAMACYLALNLVLPKATQYVQSSRSALVDSVPVWAAIAGLPLSAQDADSIALPLVVVAVALASACYLFALRHVLGRYPGNIATVVVVGWPFLFYLVSALALPNLSGDLYAYMVYARVAFVHGANPYAVMPSAFAADAFTQYAAPGISQITTPYGTVWTYLSILVGQLTNAGGIAANLLALRLLLFAFNLLNLWLIWLTLGRVKPELRMAGVVFYGWSPIVVLKGMGHVEPVMVTFLLLSVYLHARGHRAGTVAALVLSVLTKFMTAPLVPIYLARIAFKRSSFDLMKGVAVAAVLTVVFFAPVWEGLETLARLARDPMSTAPGSLFTPRRLIATPALVVAVLWAMWYGRSSVQRLLVSYTAVLLCLSLLFTPVNFAWYTITLIGIASLVVDSRIARIALVFGFSSLAMTTIGELVREYATLPSTASRLIWWGPTALASVWLFRFEVVRIIRLPVQRSLRAPLGDCLVEKQEV